MKLLTNLASRGFIALMDNGDVFPINPIIGQFALVTGVLYIYSSIGGFSAWHPLTRQTQHFKFVQNSPSTQWIIDHDLNSDDLIIGIYDSNNMLSFPASISFTNLNRIVLNFSEAISGKALIFSMSNSTSIGANFKYYTDSVYEIGTKASNFIVNLTDGSVQNVELTGVCSCSFTGFPILGRSAGVVMNIINGKDKITFPGVKWSGGVVPTLSTGFDRLFFTSGDAGNTIFGFTSGLDMK